MPDCLVIDFTLRLGRSESPCLCCGTNHVFGIDKDRDGSSVDLRVEIEQWLYARRFVLEGKRLHLIVEPVQEEARDA